MYKKEYVITYIITYSQFTIYNCINKYYQIFTYFSYITIKWQIFFKFFYL